MKNYLGKHYQHYYVQTADWQSLETTREVCIASTDEPTAENPYKQRWFYDLEAGYIVRLERSEHGESIYRMNATAFKREERYIEGKFRCLRKDTGDCDDDCGNCQKTRIARTVELDKPISFYGDDDEPIYPDVIASDTEAPRKN
jgi:hypothetical protein